MLNQLRQQIRESGLTYDEVDAGCGCGRSWLDKFMQDRFADYGFKRIEKLRAFVESQTGARQSSGQKASDQHLPPALDADHQQAA